MIEKKRAITFAVILILTVAFISSLFTMAVTGGLSGVRDGFVLDSKQYQDWSYYKELEQIKDAIASGYYQDVDTNKLYEGALKGMVEALNDPYSSYYTADEFRSKLEDLTGTYSGAGMTVSADPESNKIVVTTVFSGTPADKAGLKAGDIIVQIDGKAMDGVKLEEATDRIKGAAGTSVTLTVKRGEKTFDVNLVRANIDLQHVTWELFDNSIGYIRMTEFDSDCAEKFDQAVKDLKDKGAVALVLDMRDNPGGFFDQAVKVADRLVEDGRIVSTRDRNGKEQEWKADGHMIDLPFAIIVNGYSASATEIVTAAVKDHMTGRIVGEKTFGKGVVQSLITLDGGSGLKLTTSEYFSPNGSRIQKVGVTPDITVSLPDELVRNPQKRTTENDTQLQKAMELFKDIQKPIAG